MSSDTVIHRDNAGLASLLAPEHPAQADRSRTPRPDPMATSRSLQFETILDRAATVKPVDTERAAGRDRGPAVPDRPEPRADTRHRRVDERRSDPRTDRSGRPWDRADRPVGDDRAPARPREQGDDDRDNSAPSRTGTDRTSTDRTSTQAEAEPTGQPEETANPQAPAPDGADDQGGETPTGVDDGSAEGDGAEAVVLTAALLAPPPTPDQTSADGSGRAAPGTEEGIGIDDDGGTGVTSGTAPAPGSAGAPTGSTPDPLDPPDNAGAGDAAGAGAGDAAGRVDTGSAAATAQELAADQSGGASDGGAHTTEDSGQPSSGDDRSQATDGGPGPLTAPGAGPDAGVEPVAPAATAIASGVPGGGGGAEQLSTVSPAGSSAGSPAVSSTSGIDGAPGPLTVDPGLTAGLTAASAADGEPLTGTGGHDPVWRQIQRGLNAVRLNAAGEHEMTIRLRPEDLGSVVVTVTTGESGTTVSLVADNRSAANQLQQQRHLLLEQLEDRGLGGATVDVGLGDSSHRGDPGEQAGRDGLTATFGGPGSSGRLSSPDAGRTMVGRSDQPTRSRVDLTL